MARNVAASLTFYNPGSEEDFPIEARIDEVNNLDMTDLRVQDGTASDKMLTDKANRDSINAANASMQNDTPDPVYNDLGQTIDQNPNTQPNSLSQIRDMTQAKLDKLINGDTSPIELSRQIQDFKIQDDETASYIKEKIKDLEDRRTEIDLTPLLALVRDPARAQAAYQILGRDQAFTQQEKDRQIQEMRLALAQHQDKNSLLLRQALIKSKKEQDQTMIKNLQEKMKITMDQGKGVNDLKKEFDDKTKNDYGIIDSSYKIIQALNDPKSYDKNGVINPQLVTQIKAWKIKAQSGGGPPSDTEARLYGGITGDIYNQFAAWVKEKTTGVPLTAKDLKYIVSLARINAGVAANQIGQKVNDYVDRTRDLQIPDNISLDIWKQYYNKVYSSPLKTIIGGAPKIADMPDDTILEIMKGYNKPSGKSASSPPSQQSKSKGGKNTGFVEGLRGKYGFTPPQPGGPNAGSN